MRPVSPVVSAAANVGPDVSGKPPPGRLRPAGYPVISTKAVEAAGWTISGVVAGLDGAGSADGSCDEDAA